MHDERRLRSDGELRAVELSQSLLAVDTAVAAHHTVTALRYAYGCRCFSGIEHYRDVFPRLTFGLPPGPIRIPTPIGIDAVLNYTRHNYIYMCAKEDFSGTHNFAANYAEHMKNARKYWKALNERKIFN